MKKKNKRIKMEKERKKSHELLVIVATISVILILLFCLNFNIPISPGENFHTTNAVVVFKWFGFSDKIIIDDNPEFNSPETINSSPGRSYTITKLEPGNYYWKTGGFSPVQSLSIESEVAIEIKNETLENKGNVPLSLQIFKGAGITTLAIVDVNQEMKIDDAEEVVASEHENE